VRPLVSVVSLSHNRKANIAELLAALRLQTYPRFEVLLVDNASTDGTAEMVRRDFAEVRLIETGSNLGAVAYNLGFEAARGAYLLEMDDDGLPGNTDWIAQVVARFEANPRLGAVCCTVRMRDTGRIAHDSPQFVPEGSTDLGYPGVAFNGTGAGLRATALRDAGGYPRHFSMIYIELHLCTKLLAAGWQLRHFPTIEVWHSRISSSSNPPLSYYGLRNYYWYVWQFYPWPHVLSETLHELGSHTKLVLRGQIPPAAFWRATRDAFLGARQVLTQRRPVSGATLKYMQWVRRHGNWHGIAPELVPFSASGLSDQSMGSLAKS
jgi:GT2 family glycosyltransferase